MKIPIVKINVVKDGEIEYGIRKISAPEMVACIWPLFKEADREYVIVCLAKNILSWEIWVYDKKEKTVKTVEM